MTVMGTPFDRVECATATLGTGNVVVTAPSPRYMRPYDAGVRDGDPITLIIEEGNDFELVEATARNCTPQSCEFTRDTVRYSSIGGVVSQAKMSLKGGARVAVVAGAADLNVHRGGTIDGNIVLNGDLAINGTLTGPNLPVGGPQGPAGRRGQSVQPEYREHRERLGRSEHRGHRASRERREQRDKTASARRGRRGWLARKDRLVKQVPRGRLVQRVRRVWQDWKGRRV